EVRALHRVRIAEILERSRLAADHALEARAQGIGPFGVAGGTGLVELLAMVGVPRRGRGRAKNEKESRTDPRAWERMRRGFCLHACTSGPGLLRYFVTIASADQ